eukprot:9884792-Ditylum_brightwellii.AAC.1
MGHPKSRSSSSTGYKQCSRDKMLHKDSQAMQLPRHFSRAEINQEHVFPKKAEQTQKHYMHRNLQFVGEMTMKEWVAQVSELNEYLKDFPAQNKNKIQPLNEDKIIDILEYGVPASWRREFT